MSEVEIAAFLSSLASESRVSASTQNQAFNALLFLYQQVLQKKIGLIEGVVRAKRPSRLPVLLSGIEQGWRGPTLMATRYLNSSQTYLKSFAAFRAR
jgi:Phage integrase, N-terminal SAM-like domain